MTSRYWYNLALTRWELLHGVDQGPVDPFTLRVTKPDATNTGVGIIAPAPTTVWSGDLTVSTAGDVIENLVVTGLITIHAPNVTIRNVEVQLNGSRSTNSWGVFCTSAYPGTRIEYSTIHGTAAPSVWINGIGSMNYTAYRSHIYDVVDGFSTYAPTSGMATNVHQQGCFVDRLLWLSPDPNHSDNHTHDDGDQLQGGAGDEMTGCYIRGWNSPLSTSSPNPQANSAIQLNASTGPTTGIAFEDNWFSGGQYTINGGGGSTGPAFTGHIWRNRFARDSAQGIPIGLNQNCGGLDTGDGTANQNVWEDTLTPITVRRNL